jgi:hypothetical protein
VGKNAGEIFLRDTDAVVTDANPDAFVAIHADADGELFVLTAAFVQGVFGVVHQIDEDLQDFVFVSCGLRHMFIIANDLNAMAGEPRGVELKGIVHQV